VRAVEAVKQILDERPRVAQTLSDEKIPGTPKGLRAFAFFVKVGTARSAVTAFLCRHE